MSEDATIDGTRRSFNEVDWEARTVVDAGPPKHMGLVIEHTTPDEKSLVTLPLTAQRARALIQLLHMMLEEAGESSGVWLTGEQLDGPTVPAAESRAPHLRSIGFESSKKTP